jgi:hypothetical protein
MSNRAPKQPKPKAQTAKKSGPKTLVKPLLAGALTALSVIGVWVGLLPHVTPSISDPVRQGDPYSSSITVTNTGPIPLDKVVIRIGVKESCDIPGCNVPAYPDPKRYDNPQEGMFLVHVRTWGEHDLGPDDRFQVPLSNVIDITSPGTLGYADLLVIIDYEIPYIHWKREKKYPLHLGHQGEWLWG